MCFVRLVLLLVAQGTLVQGYVAPGAVNPTANCCNTYSGAVSTASAIADLDGNGYGDIVIAPVDGTPLQVFMSNANGMVPKVGPSFVTGVVNGGLLLLDVNRDGKPDVVVTGQGGTVQFAVGNGDGMFGAVTTLVAGVNPSASGGMVAAADINRDGFPGLAVVVPNVGIRLLAGVDGGFNAPGAVRSAPGVSRLRVVDLDNDGYPEMVYTTDSQLFVLKNLQGTLVTVAAFPLPGASQIGEILPIDYTGDGFMDLVVVDYPTGTLYKFKTVEGLPVADRTLSGNSNTTVVLPVREFSDNTQSILAFSSSAAPVRYDAAGGSISGPTQDTGFAFGRLPAGSGSSGIVDGNGLPDYMLMDPNLSLFYALSPRSVAQAVSSSTRVSGGGNRHIYAYYAGSDGELPSTSSPITVSGSGGNVRTALSLTVQPTTLTQTQSATLTARLSPFIRRACPPMVKRLNSSMAATSGRVF